MQCSGAYSVLFFNMAAEFASANTSLPIDYMLHLEEQYNFDILQNVGRVWGYSQDYRDNTKWRDDIILKEITSNRKH